MLPPEFARKIWEGAWVQTSKSVSWDEDGTRSMKFPAQSLIYGITGNSLDDAGTGNQTTLLLMKFSGVRTFTQEPVVFVNIFQEQNNDGGFYLLKPEMMTKSDTLNFSMGYQGQGNFVRADVTVWHLENMQKEMTV